MRPSACPRFRPDLVVRRVVESGDAGYTIYDPARNQYYRQDPLTRYVCELLDGRRTRQDVLEELERRYPQYSFDEEFLAETLEGLQKQGFIEDAFQRNLLVQERARAARKRLLSADSLKNILAIQFGSVNPMPLFDKIYPFCRVVFSRWWVLGTTIASFVAIGMLWDRREVLVGNLMTVFTLENSTWLGLAILYVTLFLIVVLHEFGHGLCCMHFGGKPRQLGFLLFYFMPGMYCDVSDLYFFEKRWPRAAVALAGGYVELQIFAVSTILWAVTPPDLLLHEIAYRVLLFSGVTGLIFNYNPLVKMDGYFVLLSWLDIPELRERSFEWLKGKSIGLITGKEQETEILTRREKRIFALYGLASVIYSVFFLWVSILLVRNIFVGTWREAGFVAFAIFLVLILRGFAKKMVDSTRLLIVEHAGLIRRKWALLAGGVALAVAVFVVPLPHWVKVDARLHPIEETPVRPWIDGRVSELTVREGTPVRRGTIVAVVASTTDDALRASSVAESEQARITARRDAIELRQSQDAGARPARARSAISSWRRMQAHIAAPIDGYVLTRRPETLLGTEVAAGDSILSVGRLDSLRIVLDLSEREIADLARGQSASLRLRSEPGRVIAFRIDAIDLSPSGEPILGETAASLAEGSDLPSRYRAYGVLDNTDGRLQPGMTGLARVRGPNLSLAQRVARAYARLVRADFWL